MNHAANEHERADAQRRARGVHDVPQKTPWIRRIRNGSAEESNKDSTRRSGTQAGIEDQVEDLLKDQAEYQEDEFSQILREALRGEWLDHE